MTPLPEAARAAIRARRIECGYTQPKAAEAAGVSITTWNSIEKGRSSGAALARAAMCRLLGWSADSIDRLERGEAPVEQEYGSGPDDEAPPAAIASVEHLIDVVEQQGRTIARLESAVRKLAGDRLLGD